LLSIWRHRLRNIVSAAPATTFFLAYVSINFARFMSIPESAMLVKVTRTP